jgi:hypothetical protein
MNVFAANQLEAADVLALARLDDDGVPPVVTPSARDGQGRHPIRPSGAGHVATGQAELIAAPGRARQQLTPALSASGSAAHSPPSARPCPRKENCVMPEPAAAGPRPAGTSPRPCTYPSGPARARRPGPPRQCSGGRPASWPGP